MNLIGKITNVLNMCDLTMDKIDVINQFTFNFLEYTCKSSTYRDRYYHSMRVLSIAKRIAEIENANMEIVEISAMLHDIGRHVNRHSHNEVGARIASELLSLLEYDGLTISKVSECILNHSGCDLNKRMSLESKIVMDADNIDGVGLMTIMGEAIKNDRYDRDAYFKVYENVLARYKTLVSEKQEIRTKTGRVMYTKKLNELDQYIKTMCCELEYNTNLLIV